jgi:hypothetical protein
MKTKTKLFQILFSTIFFLSISSGVTYSETSTHKTNNPINDDAIISLLLDEINEAIQNYYKDPNKSFWKAKIIDLKRIGDGIYEFEVSIELETFEGAHNPPYGKDTLVFTRKIEGIKLIKYLHKSL